MLVLFDIVLESDGDDVSRRSIDVNPRIDY